MVGGGKTVGRVKAGRTSAARTPSPISPLAPRSFPSLPPIAGVRLGTASAGVKYPDRTDVLFAVLAPGTQAGGVFTRSKTASAPVEWCRKCLKAGSARALVANSGNANAFTGRSGLEAVQAVAMSAAGIVGCRAQEIIIASTGVIGEPLPAEKITRVLGAAAQDAAMTGWRSAAEAIMTTDTFPKLATRTASIDGQRVTINGIAKGSGMIAPDMATMLAFVFTDAALPSVILQDLVAAGARASFNAITVDSDTSTSDSFLLFATGKGASHAAISRTSDKRLADFKEKLNELSLDLALQIVRDGEGAKKLIRIDVSGATSDESARRVARSIANSPLVKAAIGGGDANWGRIVMAVGKAGEPADRDRLRISFGGHVVAENGARAASYNEGRATKAVNGPTVEIAADLGMGKGTARVWTCDLTEDYVRINGAYRS